MQDNIVAVIYNDSHRLVVFDSFCHCNLIEIRRLIGTVITRRSTAGQVAIGEILLMEYWQIGSYALIVLRQRRDFITQTAKKRRNAVNSVYVVRCQSGCRILRTRHQPKGKPCVGGYFSWRVKVGSNSSGVYPMFAVKRIF